MERVQEPSIPPTEATDRIRPPTAGPRMPPAGYTGQAVRGMGAGPYAVPAYPQHHSQLGAYPPQPRGPRQGVAGAVARPPTEWARLNGHAVEGTRVDLAVYRPVPSASIPLPVKKGTFQQRHPLLHYILWVIALTVGAVLAFFGVLYLLDLAITVTY